MSSFDRRRFLISSASFGALAGCGFAPTYAPGGRAAALRGRVEIDAPSDRDSYSLVNRLTDTFGTPSMPLYRLSYKITTDQNQIGVTRTQEISRYHVTGKVSYTLFENASGRAVMTDNASSFTAYSATGSAVDTFTAARDAYARLMVILADQMVNQIIAMAEIAA